MYIRSLTPSHLYPSSSDFTHYGFDKFWYIFLTYCPNRPASSTFRWSLGRYFSSFLTIISCSFFTALRFTDGTSPCCQISLRLYLIKLLYPVLLSLGLSVGTHVLRNFWTQPSLLSLSFSGTLSLSSKWAHFSTSIAPMTVSCFCSICSTHNLKAFSTSGLITTHAC